jgi:ABC-type dipeptide/oligopeptide/nickel transport system permease component
MTTNGAYRVTILATIVALALMVAVVVLVALLRGSFTESTPAIAVLIGLIAPTITALLALLRVETVQKQHIELNGAVQRLQAHIEEAATRTEKAAQQITDVQESSP